MVIVRGHDVDFKGWREDLPADKANPRLTAGAGISN